MGAHSLAEAFVRNAERAPDKLCLRFEGEEWTYRRLRDDTALSAEKNVDYCRRNLAGYKEPREVVFVDALPRNALGKVLKHEVRKKTNRSGGVRLWEPRRIRSAS